MSAAIDRICCAIADDGYAVEADFLPRSTIAALMIGARARDDAGDFHAAGMGRGDMHGIRRDQRGDRIRWLDDEGLAPSEITVCESLNALRLAINERLQLGLFSLEAHYALYPPGASYARHIDRFHDEADSADIRVLSCALYLNQDWMPADRGELRIYNGDRVRDVLPSGGTLVCFLSDRFEHEVLPSTRERWSMTGWFRRRP